MATFSIVTLPAKTLKGGRHKVRIAIAHNGETRYIPTDIILNSLSELKGGCIVKRPDAAILNAKLQKLLLRYSSTLLDASYIEGMTCPELVCFLKGASQTKHRSIQSVHEEYITHADATPSTLYNYKVAWKAITNYFNPLMLTEHINHATVISIDMGLRKGHKICSSTHRNYMQYLSTLINYAKRCGYAEYKIDPFAGYKMPKPTVAQTWLSVNDIKAIRDIKHCSKGLARCRDFFMLSYYLGGINMEDLKEINFNECNRTLKYIRSKTAKRLQGSGVVKFKIPQEAMEIIRRHKGEDGRIVLSKSERGECLNGFFSYYMPKLASAAGIKKVVYYSARKSFSQHAFDLGVQTAIIDYILGHKANSGGTALYSYIRVTPEMATSAIRKVLDNLK